MWKIVVSGIILLAVMEGVALYALKINKAEVKEVQSSAPQVLQDEIKSVSTQEREELSTSVSGQESSEYPKITTEVVNGRTERTIHMGVRKWVWEPNVIRAKQGELVRLIIHNADVNHPLYIPELGIEAEVPPEGAVVEFEAKKKGSFFFLCGTYCGEGHAEMQGTLIIE
jgi:cytochrome c oxidase subunit 2